MNNSLLLCIWVILLCSCSANRFLSKNEHFYDGAKIIFEHDTLDIKKRQLSTELKEVLEPKANRKLLGARPGVWFYYKIGEPEKKKGFKYWAKKNLAKNPVLTSDIRSDLMVSRLKEYLHCEGYFRNEVIGRLESKEHTTKAIYSINTGPGYTIKQINYPGTSEIYHPLLTNIKENSLLKVGDKYSFKVLQEEQKRIENYLEDNGFYFFDDNYLVHLADTTIGNYKVELTLKLSEDTPDEDKRIFTYTDVELAPNYAISIDTSASKTLMDTINNYIFIDNNDYIRPDILAQTVVFQKGDVYSEKAQTKTRERLMSLGTYKFVNLKFTRMDSTGLKSQIFLTPLPKKSIRLDIQAVSNSNNNEGPSFTASFQNRNTFRGAELLELKLNASYEVQVGGQNDPPLNAYELNLESSVTIPRLITPFNINYRSLRFIPQTRFSLGLRQLRRLDVFQINSLEGQYGFIWQESYSKQHKFYPINISYLLLGNTSEAFDERLLEDPNLARSLENQFILGAQYEYIFSSKNAKKNNSRKHHYYFNGLLDFSGNLANGIVTIFDVETRDEGSFRFSQYTKVQLDFRHFKKIGEQNELASRLLLGGARAYGNSTDVPFVKQFSSGGSNGLRAFRARSVGPGAYMNDETGNLIIDETGDIKIEANIEYRSSLGGIFESAFFVDAGNIWLWNDRNNLKPEGEFVIIPTREYYLNLITKNSFELFIITKAQQWCAIGFDKSLFLITSIPESLS